MRTVRAGETLSFDGYHREKKRVSPFRELTLKTPANPTLARPIDALPSEPLRFTTVFGMGTGGTTVLNHRETLTSSCNRAGFRISVSQLRNVKPEQKSPGPSLAGGPGKSNTSALDKLLNTTFLAENMLLSRHLGCAQMVSNIKPHGILVPVS